MFSTLRQLDSVNYLHRVNLAFYLMKRAENGHQIIRFGVIGVRGQTNTALNRLAQNSAGQRIATFLEMVVFSDNMDCGNLTIVERGFRKWLDENHENRATDNLERRKDVLLNKNPRCLFRRYCKKSKNCWVTNNWL